MTDKPWIHHHKAEQGSDEWYNLRIGKLTASNVSSIVTPTLKLAANDKTRALLNKAAVERITEVAEETYTTEAMLRGHIDEEVARDLYTEKYAKVSEVGFITNDKYPNFGYSPDGLVGDDGLIEVKSRAPHLQFSTIIANQNGGIIPKEYMAQIQSGLLISEREWCDFLSFSHGLPMLRQRVFPDPEYQEAIMMAAYDFETSVTQMIGDYEVAVADSAAFTPTERIDYEGMIL